MDEITGGKKGMINMFEKFDTVEELNRAAADKLKTGNIEEIMKLAMENGLEKEDAEDYINGVVNELATPLLAAVGKLNMESRELGLKGIVNDWKEYVTELCTEDEKMCAGVMKKNKSLNECMARLLRFAFDNKAKLNDRIVTAANLKPPIYLGIPNRSEARNIIKEYYTEGIK